MAHKSVSRTSGPGPARPRLRRALGALGLLSAGGLVVGWSLEAHNEAVTRPRT